MRGSSHSQTILTATQSISAAARIACSMRATVSPITAPLQVRHALAEEQPVKADVVLFHGSHERVVKVSGLPDAIQPSEGGRIGGDGQASRFRAAT